MAASIVLTARRKCQYEGQHLDQDWQILPHSAPTDQLNSDQLSLSWWVGATSGIIFTYLSVDPAVRIQNFKSWIGAIYSPPYISDTQYYVSVKRLWIQHLVSIRIICPSQKYFQNHIDLIWFFFIKINLKDTIFEINCSLCFLVGRTYFDGRKSIWYELTWVGLI